MLRVRDGDAEAFTELVERFHADVLALADRSLRDRAAAEDVVQETFLRVYRARERYTPEAALRTWIYRIAVNLCVSEIRARKRRRTIVGGVGAGGGAEDAEGRGGVEPADPAAADPSDGLARTELGELLRAAMEDLPETQRMALILNKFHELPYKEVADALEMSVPAVKSLLARARANVRDKLPPDLYEG